MKLLVSSLLLAACVLWTAEAEEGKQWALLVAGSNGYFNYRHQADICHAYQIMHKHGIPDERIVVMMYDDIANNQENPDKGVIINHANGSNVYPGVPKDYTGKDVTPDNFLKILQGDVAGMSGIGSGKVIASGPNDHIFVNFADHGAPGLVAFPDDMLYARDLIDTLKSMHDQNKYKQMVFYLEACESGSMFDQGKLQTDFNIYATTAANGKESSYACYFDAKLNTYLGDLYSVKWMEDSDKKVLSQETLYQQYKIVKQETNMSHVQEFGNMAISREDVSEFQGSAQGVSPVVLPTMQLDAVRSEDVPIQILQRSLQAATTAAEAAKIRAELQEREQIHLNIERSMRSIVAMAAKTPDDVDRLLFVHQPLTAHACYRDAVSAYVEHCFDVFKYDYAMRQFYALVNLCEEGRPSDLVRQAIQNVCTLQLY